jgi:uridine kinase
MPVTKPDIQNALEKILELRAASNVRGSILVGLSGIDASGKGFVADRIVAALLDRQVRAVVLHGDGWLNLPDKRFNSVQPGQHFYEHALRLDEMFQQLILPLKAKGSHCGIMEFVEETATAYRLEPYSYDDVEVIVLECIFLFKPAYRGFFDLAIWVDCSFELALDRAIRRAQEGLSIEETIRAYETIYFPAQRIHLANDRPRDTADVIMDND